jgi:hypothetical protein
MSRDMHLLIKNVKQFLYMLFAFALLSAVNIPHALAQQNSGQKLLTGRVINSKDSSPLPDVHIINIKSARGTSSNANGSFMIMVEQHDQLLFQSLGFHNDTLVIDFNQYDDYVVIALREQVYELPVVEVFPYNSFTDFKYAFLNFKDKEPVYELHLPNLPNLAVPSEGFGVTIPGPITAIYDQFSKRGRELRKYQEVLVAEDLHRRASRVVNVETVKRYTTLQDEAEIYRFLRYCNMSDEYIVSVSEYEVYRQLLACFNQYTLEKK